MNRIKEAVKDFMNGITLLIICFLFLPVFIVTLMVGEKRIEKIFGDDDLV